MAANTKIKEQVLVITNKDLPESTNEYNEVIKFTSSLQRAKAKFIDRDKAENDTSFKQLIPYILVKRGKQFLTYPRKGKEGRLHGYWSLGYGGHINPKDAHNKEGKEFGLQTISVYNRGMIREVKEELKFDLPIGLSAKGIINDNSNEVGQVHLGIIHILELRPGQTVKPDNVNARWEMAHEIVNRKDEFENWSKIVMDLIF